MNFYLATQNQHKVKEFQQFSDDRFAFVAHNQKIEIEEIYDSFLENAYLKAKTYAKETGLVSLSDDSGLIVPSLGGEPGVFSARYNALDNFIVGEGVGQDRANNLKLLAKLEGNTERRAIFVCVLVLVLPSMPNFPIVAQGVCKGGILNINSSKLPPHIGFGYDMIFVPDGCQESFANMPMEAKNLISHRGKAIKSLNDILVKINLQDF